MNIQWLVVLGAAVAAYGIGFIWYHPKVMGGAWMKETGISFEDGKGKNMALMFILTFIFAFLIAISLMPITIHQMGLFSLGIQGEEFNGLIEKYGSSFRTFKHGAFHGLLTSIFLLLPVIATSALYERKSWKYIFINWGYWAICFIIMGGIICQWGITYVKM